MANIPVSGGSYVATNPITRDGVTEHMQIINISDPSTGLTASVTPNGLVIATSGPKNRVTLYTNNVAGNGTEAAITTTQTVNGTLFSSGATSYTVPASKTFRVTLIRFMSLGGGAGFSALNFRTISTSGAIESQIYQYVVSSSLGGTVDILTFADGSMEFAAGTVLYLTQVTNAVGSTFSVMLNGYYF